MGGVRSLLVVSAMVLLLCVGCGRVTEFETGLLKMLESNEAAIPVYESITDEASAKAAVPKLQELRRKRKEGAALSMNDLQGRYKELMKFSTEHKDRSEKVEAAKRLELARLTKIPKVAEILSEANVMPDPLEKASAPVP